ncbi:MAG TPA: glycoside hydrolase family 43 protein [Allosphingosinicella sp.]
MGGRLLRAALAAALALGEAAAAPPCPDAAGAPGGTGPRLLLDENFPDPFVSRLGGAYHGYATGAQQGQARVNVKHISAPDLGRWSAPAEALPSANLPAWVDRADPQVWAPEVIRIGGRYILYFNARHRILTRAETPPGGPVVRQRHCLGAAVADRPEGPFAGVPQPLVCAAFRDGVIDPSPFRDGRRLYLYFKDDGNCCGRRSAIYGVRLSADGLRAIGKPRKLLVNDDGPEAYDDWEWRVVEAPTMIRRFGIHWLFYSGNFYGNKNYGVGYLRCAGPLGPCRDEGRNPILRSFLASPIVGPGHQSILRDRGLDRIFFHAWNVDPDGREEPGVHKRCLYVAAIDWTQPFGEIHPRVPGGEPAIRGGK